MSLLKEINELASISEELTLISEENLNTLIGLNEIGDNIAFEVPTKKHEITKTKGEERIHQRPPTPQKGSVIKLKINNKDIVGIVTDDEVGNLIVSYKDDGKVVRMSPQPRNKFKFVGKTKTDKPVFELV